MKHHRLRSDVTVQDVTKETAVRDALRGFKEMHVWNVPHVSMEMIVTPVLMVTMVIRVVTQLIWFHAF